MTEEIRLHCVEIQRIANLVLRQCDGAKQADGRGFSRGDLTIGRALAVAPIHLWSEKLAGKGAHILRKHRRQVPEETALLQEICGILPDPELVDTPVPAIVTEEKGILVIASEPIGTTEAKRKEFAKMAKALGFVQKPEGHWILEREFDLSKMDDPIERLAKLGWHVLPEASGYLDSHLAHIRLHAEALRQATLNAALARKESEQKSVAQVQNATLSDAFINRIRSQYNPALHKVRLEQSSFRRFEEHGSCVRLEKYMTKSGRIGYILAFDLSANHAHTAEICAAYQNRFIRAENDVFCFNLENPTDADIHLAKQNARAWGVSGGDELP